MNKTLKIIPFKKSDDKFNLKLTKNPTVYVNNKQIIPTVKGLKKDRKINFVEYSKKFGM